MKLSKYYNGIIEIEIQSRIPERFINLLWKNEIMVKNIARVDITTMTMEINIRDYDKIKDLCKRTETKVRIIGRQGLFFYLFQIKRHLSLVGGVAFFALAILYLSTFMWSIDITADKYISPYEIRQRLYSYGIKPGIAKSKINVKQLEDRVMKDTDDIMYFRARIEGSTLKITVGERVAPPEIVEDNEPCDVVAKEDGEILRIFSTAGTPVVQTGDKVKKGQILIKGEQGKEGAVYPVHAKGQVMANTFYEYEREMQIKGIRYEATGRTVENSYIEVLGKKIYLKKGLNKFTNYDKIIDNKGYIKREIFKETKAVEFELDKKQVVDSTVEELYKKTMESFDKSAKLKDTIVESEQNGNNLKIRVVFVVEIDIAQEQKAR
ncbi:sporulation protein YqfD [Clostridium thermarum]|uniref:sporulation protein YqfD n=1 Tax=Clostridium thermarum TaxID=1716543 RepID=UPI0013D0BD0E|nr:sporulation protein YqfD [Clostridium thermarum]